MTSALHPYPPRDGSRTIERVPGLAVLSSRYDLILSDVWGVLHDGIAAFPHAGEALRRFRAEGGRRVVLISNAPRPGFVVARHLAALGVPEAAYDAIVTSGDVTRRLVAEQHGATMFHLGPERDIRLFDGIEARAGRLDEADFVVCTGLVDDETETVAHYADILAGMRARDLLMICANPDIVVERGHLLIPCAGALAAAYEAIGGRTLTGGKPYRPIYEAAIEAGAAAMGGAPNLSRVLAIGDAIRTDVVGARDFGIDVLMVARGIHAAELRYAQGAPAGQPALDWLATQAAQPTALAPELVWN